MTAAQRRILSLAGDGFTTREIADLTGWTYSTVHKQFKCVLHLLGARTRAHAFAIAYRRGLVT